MRVLIAPDKFKDALDAGGVCDAIEKGIKLCDSTIPVRKHPLADGGEGTAGILTFHNNGRFIRAAVHDPLFRKIDATFGLSGDEKTAFIEMASASGLQRLKPEERNCYHTTSYGTGELILKALEYGVQHIVLGIGGSATHDAGMGMATALGYRFLDVEGNELFPAGKNLAHVYSIRQDHLFFETRRLSIEVACDVQNPLTGSNGAAHVYATQKGASAKQVAQLEAGTRQWHSVVKNTFGKDLASLPGSGAAGGMGAGLMAFMNATLKPGIELVMEQTNFREAVKGCDLVITGEGKIDEQNLKGKVVKGVAQAGREFGVSVAALCGTLKADPGQLSALGIHYASSILQAPATLDDALNNTSRDLEDAAYYLASLAKCLSER